MPCLPNPQDEKWDSFKEFAAKNKGKDIVLCLVTEEALQEHEEQHQQMIRDMIGVSASLGLIVAILGVYGIIL